MTLPIPVGVYGIDSTHSQIGFGIRHLGISTVRGTFDSFSGNLTVGADLASTSVEVVAEVKSVNSGSDYRDRHLLGADFFDVDVYPTLSFTSTGIAESDGGYEMTGDLTVRDVTKSITLAVTFNGSAVFPMDNSTHHGFTATGRINRSDFGVNYGIPLAADRCDLLFECQFIAPA